MNWDAIGAIGETIGALAVIVTLAYLAIQVRVSRSVAADANRLTRATGVREFCLAATENDALISTMTTAFGMQAYLKEFAEQFGISETEAARLDWALQSFFWLHYGQFASTNDEKSAAELAKVARAFYAVPAIKFSWENGPFGKSFMDPSFGAFIDSLAIQNTDLKP
jgi:hypothetical protein